MFLLTIGLKVPSQYLSRFTRSHGSGSYIRVCTHYALFPSRTTRGTVISLNQIADGMFHYGG